MAYARVEFFSQALSRTVEFQAILPELPAGGEKLQTLYLLHGAYGSSSDWIQYTRISLWAQELGLAVILPSGENSYYTDDVKGRTLYSQFVGAELVAYTRALFPLSDKREDTFICGLSMGGYGAITNGLKYCDTFGYVAGLSASLRVDEYPQAPDNPETMYLRSRGYLERTFGDLDKVAGSDKDYRSLALLAAKKQLPALYLCCGTEDDLLPHNRDFHNFLLNHHIPHTYEEGPGDHDWDFWNSYIQKVLDWLPLKQSD